MSQQRKNTFEPGQYSVWFGLGLVYLMVFFLWPRPDTPDSWSEAERQLLVTLQLDSLPPLPPDNSNRIADNALAAKFGHFLFFDTRLSENLQISCATCHQPALRFTDGLPTARALGFSKRNTPSIAGVAYSPWLYWDGRKDSLWAQALSPLEDPTEHGSNRMYLARLVTSDAIYADIYSSLFGSLPDFSDSERFPDNAGPTDNPLLQQAWMQMQAADQRLVNTVFANIGKAIAAYERQIMPGPARFDTFLQAVLKDNHEAGSKFTEEEAAGLHLFLGPARCMECHNGPLFTNNEFHNTGLLPPSGQLPDPGRSSVLKQLREDPFNCLGEFSDADSSDCAELKYMREGPELTGAMRTPSLRNLGATAPYMHKGQMRDLDEVLAHYNKAPQALIGHNEATPLGLSRRELLHLAAFLLTLDAPLATDPVWLSAPE